MIIWIDSKKVLLQFLGLVLVKALLGNSPCGAGFQVCSVGVLTEGRFCVHAAMRGQEMEGAWGWEERGPQGQNEASFLGTQAAGACLSPPVQWV